MTSELTPKQRIAVATDETRIMYMSNLASYRRIIAIQEILESYYDDKGVRTEKIANFGELTAEVITLRELGGKVSWQHGIDCWINTIDRAVNTFCEENGLRTVYGAKSENFFGPVTREEFARRFQWALYQGSTYCFAAAH